MLKKLKKITKKIKSKLKRLKKRFIKFSKNFRSVDNVKSYLSKISQNIKSVFVGITKKKDFYFVLTILLLGLIPLIWYKPDFIALGHDMGWPLDPIKWFERRLSTWDETQGLGADQSILMAGVVLHGIEAFFYWLTGSVLAAQQITYIFWFTFPGLAAYYMIRSLVGTATSRYPTLIGAILYMFNLFMLQGWFIAERNKFAILGAIPICIVIIHKVFKRKLKPIYGAILISLLFMIFNGGGSLPLYGSVIIYLPLAFIFFGLFNLKKMSEIWYFLRFGIYTVTTFVFANAFWILPQIISLRTGFSSGVEGAGGLDGVKVWISEISQNANYIDLLRLQGLPDWSDSHIYGPVYTGNAILIFVSFLFIAVAIYGVIRNKNKKLKALSSYFLGALIFSILMSAGSNGFLGEGYFWMVENIPLFVVFRTPFYKFGGGTVLALTFLFGFGVTAVVRDLKSVLKKYFNNLQNINLGVNLIKIMIPIMLISYTYPFLTGSFFNWNPEHTTMVNVPEYVLEYADYADTYRSKNPNGRTLIIPALGLGNGLDVTEWDFFSLDSVLNLSTKKSHLPVVIGTGNETNEFTLTETLYESLRTNRDPLLTQTLIDQLGVDSILFRKDVLTRGNVIIENIEPWENHLTENTNIRLEKEFGKWQLFEINHRDDIYSIANKTTIVDSDAKVQEDLHDLGLITLDEMFELYDSTNILDESIATKQVLSLQAGNAEILDNKALFEKEALFQSYQVYSKPADLSQIWYKLDIRTRDGDTVLGINRPATDIVVNEEETLSTSPKKQEINIESTEISRVILNGNVFNLPAEITDEPKDFDFTQLSNSQLSIRTADTKDLEDDFSVLNDLSFETSVWDGLQICGGVLNSRNIDLRRIPDSTDGRFSAQLSSAGPTTVCLVQGMSNLDVENLYRLTFDYKNTAGYPLRYCILQKARFADENGNRDRGCLVEQILDDSDEWQTHSLEFLPSSAEEHVLHFYTDGEEGLESINLIDNVRVQSIETENVGGFELNTGIELSQIFQIDSQSFENLGQISLNNQTDFLNKIQIDTESGELTDGFIQDGSFEDTVWGGINFCGGDPDVANLSISKSDDTTDGESSLLLASQNGIACVFNPIQSFRPSLIYKLSFDYKNIEGNPAQFCALVRTTEGSDCEVFEEFEKSSQWQSYSTTIGTNQNILGIIPHLYSPSELGETSTNLFDNFKVEVVYNPIESIYLASNFESELESSNANILITKNSPTRYHLNIQNLEEKELVSLNVGYSPLWQTRSKEGVFKNLTEDLKTIIVTLRDGSVEQTFEHFEANGVENGWVVDQNGDYRIIYVPQLFFHAGLFITFSYLSLLVVFSIIFKVKKSKK